jgi:hypothetical protein
LKGNRSLRAFTTQQYTRIWEYCEDGRRTEWIQEGIQHRAILLVVLNLRNLGQTSHLWQHSQVSRRKTTIFWNAKEKLLIHKACITSRTLTTYLNTMPGKP